MSEYRHSIYGMVPYDHWTIIEDTQEAFDNFGHGYGSFSMILRPEHLEALKRGKVLAYHGDEYVTFLSFHEKE